MADNRAIAMITITQQLKETVPLFELLTVGESVSLTLCQAAVINQPQSIEKLSDHDLLEYLVAKCYLGLDTLAEIDEMIWQY